MKLYSDNPSRTDYQSVDGRGHSLTIDAGWPDVARIVLDWLDGRHADLVAADTTEEAGQRDG